MVFLKRIKKLIENRKKIKITPEILGQGLVSQAFDHTEKLFEICNKREKLFQIDNSKKLFVFEELFNFYFSLFSYAPLLNEMSGLNANIFGKQLLEEAFNALSEVPLDIETMLDEPFMDIFDEDFRFYYHDQIPEDEIMELQKVMKICKGEEGDWSDNWLGYLSVKLHYRLCKTLNISIENGLYPFIGLYVFNMNSVKSYYSGVLKKITM